MFNHKQYQAYFLENYQKNTFTNNSVALVDKHPTLTDKFQIIGIHHLMASENVGKHNLYIDVIDINGNRLPEKIEWGWEGQRPNEIVHPLVLDKPPHEPSGNISMGMGQVLWAKVWDKKSDTLKGVTTLCLMKAPGILLVIILITYAG